MTLTNYWWLLIWIAVVGSFLAIACPKQPVKVLGKTEYRWGWGPAILLVSPYVIWAMNREWFGDTEVYRKTFLEIPNSLGAIPSYIASQPKDKGFSVLQILLKMIIGNHDKIFFLIIAAFQMYCVVYFFRKYSANYLFCIFMFIASTDYLSWMHNGMRQFIAVGIVLFSFEFVLKEKYVPAVLLILLAATIHGSAIIMLPIIFVVQGKAWNKRTILMLVAVVIIVMFIGEFTSILDNMLAETQYNDLITNEIWVNDDGTNMLRVLFYSIPAVLSLIGKKYIDEESSPIINMCVNCSACTMFLYILAAFSSGIYIGRLPIYTTLPGYVAAPWIIDHMFTKESARLVKIGLIGGYLLFFYYQMHIGWNLI